MTSTLAPATTSTTSAPSAEYIASQASTQAPEKPSEIPISAPSNDNVGTSIPTPDPYFTHFDPRMEHQSYKVGLDVKKLLNNLHDNSSLHACIHRSEPVLAGSIKLTSLSLTGSATASRGEPSRKGDEGDERLVWFGRTLSRHALGRPQISSNLQAEDDRQIPSSIICSNFPTHSTTLALTSPPFAF